MISALVAKILAGFAAALGLALVITLTVWVPNLYEKNAQTKAALNSALEANASLITERDTAKRETARNQAISAAAIKDTADLNAKVAAIKERLRNGQACVIDPADADALDRLFKPAP